ncbi:putative CTD small phosphatase-like protein 2 [Quillaja saponaria]|uniref:CTD small phosphatase-like protein 2 n=1 Tax=Quillaja saponaria TaxID=32244 RepID=A0AAD7VMH9_QUISA|nr:putative CTD small phosphatase-like protein 2 [Quillaja saponaria]
MEDFFKLSMKKAVSAKEISTISSTCYPDDEEEELEESGWTSYFEDFSNAKMENSFGGSSLVSDAASCAAWNFSSANNIPKKLKFKKSRTTQISEDDSLEDTASSPVNSPTDKDKGLASGHYSEGQREYKNEVKFNGKIMDCTELKKKGHCLLPLSRLVNYYG